MTGLSVLILQSFLIRIILMEKTRANQSGKTINNIGSTSMNHTVLNIMDNLLERPRNNLSKNNLQDSMVKSLHPELMYSQKFEPSKSVHKYNYNINYLADCSRLKSNKNQRASLFKKSNSEMYSARPEKENASVKDQSTTICKRNSTENPNIQQFTKEIYINKNSTVRKDPIKKVKLVLCSDISPQLITKSIVTPTHNPLQGFKHFLNVSCPLTYHEIINMSGPVIPDLEKKKSVIDGCSINKKADDMSTEKSNPTVKIEELSKEEKELAKKKTNSIRKLRECPYPNFDRLRAFRLMHSVYRANEDEMNKALRAAHLHIQSVANEFNSDSLLKSSSKDRERCNSPMITNEESSRVEMTSEKFIYKRKTDQPKTSPQATQVTAPYQILHHESIKMYPPNKLDTLVDEIRRRQEELSILQQIFDKERKHIEAQRSSEKLKKSKAILHHLFGSSSVLLKDPALPLHLNKIITPQSLKIDSEFIKSKSHTDNLINRYSAPGRIDEYDSASQQNELFKNKCQQSNLTMNPSQFKMSSYINNKNISSLKYSSKPITRPNNGRSYCGTSRKKRGLLKGKNKCVDCNFSEESENNFPAGPRKEKNTFKRSSVGCNTLTCTDTPVLGNLSAETSDLLHTSLTNALTGNNSNNFSILSSKPSRRLEKRWIFSAEKQITTIPPSDDHNLFRRLAHETFDTRSNEVFNETKKNTSQAEISADKLKKELSDDYCSKFANLHTDLLALEKSIQSLKRVDIEGVDGKTDSGSVVIQVNVSVEVLNGTAEESKNMIGRANNTLKVRKCGRTVVSLGKPKSAKKEETNKGQAPVTSTARSAKIVSSKPVGQKSRNHFPDADKSPKEIIKSAGIFTWIKPAPCSGWSIHSNGPSFFKPLTRLRRNGPSQSLQKTHSLLAKSNCNSDSVGENYLAKTESPEYEKNHFLSRTSSKYSMAREFSVSLNADSDSMHNKFLKRTPMSFIWTDNDKNRTDVISDKKYNSECTMFDPFRHGKQLKINGENIMDPKSINSCSSSKKKEIESTQEISQRGDTSDGLVLYNEEDVSAHEFSPNRRLLSVNLEEIPKTTVSNFVTERNIRLFQSLKPTKPMKTKLTHLAKRSLENKFAEYHNQHFNRSLERSIFLLNHSNSDFISKVVRKKRMENLINKNNLYLNANEFDIVLNQSKSKSKIKLPILWENQFNISPIEDKREFVSKHESKDIDDKFQKDGALKDNNFEDLKTNDETWFNKQFNSSKFRYGLLKKPSYCKDAGQTAGRFKPQIHEFVMSQSEFEPNAYTDSEPFQILYQNVCTKSSKKKMTLSTRDKTNKNKLILKKLGHSRVSKHDCSLTRAADTIPAKKLFHGNITVLGPGNCIEQEGINMVKFPCISRKESSNSCKRLSNKNESQSLLSLKPGEYLLLSSGNKHIKIRLGSTITSSPLHNPDYEEILSLITKNPKELVTSHDDGSVNTDILVITTCKAQENTTDGSENENEMFYPLKYAERILSGQKYKMFSNHSQKSSSNDDLLSSPVEDSILDVDTLTMEDDSFETCRPTPLSNTAHKVSNSASRKSKIRAKFKTPSDHTPLKWVHTGNVRDENKNHKCLCHRCKSSNTKIIHGPSKCTNKHDHNRFTPSPVTETLYFAGYTIKIGSTSPREDIKPLKRGNSVLEPVKEKVSLPSMKDIEHDVQKKNKNKGNKKNKGHQILLRARKKRKRVKVLEKT